MSDISNAHARLARMTLCERARVDLATLDAQELLAKSAAMSPDARAAAVDAMASRHGDAVLNAAIDRLQGRSTSSPSPKRAPIEKRVPITKAVTQAPTIVRIVGLEAIEKVMVRGSRATVGPVSKGAPSPALSLSDAIALANKTVKSLAIASAFPRRPNGFHNDLAADVRDEEQCAVAKKYEPPTAPWRRFQTADMNSETRVAGDVNRYIDDASDPSLRRACGFDDAPPAPYRSDLWGPPGSGDLNAVLDADRRGAA